MDQSTSWRLQLNHLSGSSQSMEPTLSLVNCVICVFLKFLFTLFPEKNLHNCPLWLFNNVEQIHETHFQQNISDSFTYNKKSVFFLSSTSLLNFKIICGKINSKKNSDSQYKYMYIKRPKLHITSFCLFLHSLTLKKASQVTAVFQT